MPWKGVGAGWSSRYMHCDANGLAQRIPLHAAVAGWHPAPAPPPTWTAHLGAELPVLAVQLGGQAVAHVAAHVLSAVGGWVGRGCGQSMQHPTCAHIGKAPRLCRQAVLHPPQACQAPPASVPDTAAARGANAAGHAPPPDARSGRTGAYLCSTSEVRLDHHEAPLHAPRAGRSSGGCRTQAECGCAPGWARRRRRPRRRCSCPGRGGSSPLQLRR